MPTYPGISSEAFRHPLDRQAEEALRNLPGFKLLASRFVEYIYERPQQIYLMGNSIKVGPRQYSTLYGIFRECLRDLDITTEPTIYVDQTPVVNSYTLGTEHPYVVVNSGLLDFLDEDELRVVVAHELGHLKCEHPVLTQMAIWAMGAASFVGDITLGLGGILTTGLLFAFYEWRRKAELSADRAALLVTDDLNPIFRTMMKLSGGSMKYAHEVSLSEFEQQSKDYEDLDQEQLNQIYKFLIYNGGRGTFLEHPFPVERLPIIRRWEESEEYQQIKSGNYTRADSGSVDVEMDDNSDVDDLRRQVEELRREIEKKKNQRNSD